MSNEEQTKTSADDFLEVDPLRDAYRKSITHAPAVTRSLRAHKTALLCIDLQYLDAAPGYGVFADVAASGVPMEAQEYYFERLQNTVPPR